MAAERKTDPTRELLPGGFTESLHESLPYPDTSTVNTQTV
jgi:hypothetical protein